MNPEDELAELREATSGGTRGENTIAEQTLADRIGYWMESDTPKSQKHVYAHDSELWAVFKALDADSTPGFSQADERDELCETLGLEPSASRSQIVSEMLRFAFRELDVGIADEAQEAISERAKF